jgi:outer membrane receptor for ferrienterochelin and colicins
MRRKIMFTHGKELKKGKRREVALKTVVLLVFIAAFTATGIHNALAKELPADLTEMSLEDLMDVQVKTVASASRHQQDISDAPASVTIVTGEQIRRYGYRTLAEVLRSVIGFNVTYDRNYYYLGMRGVGLPGDYNARILLMVDGHRFNESTNDSFFSGPGLGIDMNDVKKVEIVRGPASALYGQNAMLAIVNVVTKGPADDSGNEVQVTLGEPGVTTLAARTRGTTGDVEYSVSVLGHHREGHHILEYPEFADPGIVDYDDPADGIADYSGFTVDSDGEEALSFRSQINVGKLAITAFMQDWEKVIPTGSFEVNFDTGEEMVQEGYYYLDLKYTPYDQGDFTWWVRGTAEHYYYNGEFPYAYNYEYDVPTWRDAPYTVFKDEWTADWQSLEFQGNFGGISSNQISFGAKYTLNSVELEGFDVDPFNVYLDEKPTFYQASAFVQDVISLTNNASLILGLNHNLYDENLYKGDVERTNPRVGVIISVGPDTRLKGLYGEAFRVPNTNEFLYNDAGESQLPNPNLEAEVIRTGELILEHDFSSSWSLRSSLYRTNLESLIQADEVAGPVGTAFQYLNSPDDIVSTGVECEIRKFISEDTSGYLSVALQRTENDQTGEKLPNSPEEMVNLGVSVPLVRGEVYLSVDNQYVGEVLTAYLDEKVDSYFLTNATISHNAVASDLEMSFSVYNLFDVDYSHPGTYDHVQTEIPQDGRTLGLNVKYSF